jgi:hypothetical protein
LNEIMFAKFSQCLDVSLQHGLERLGIGPFRMLGCHRPHPIERKCQLDIHWLFNPERAIVVERRDTLGRRDKLRAAGFGYPTDEFNDGLLRRGGVPDGNGSPSASAGIDQPKPSASPRIPPTMTLKPLRFICLKLQCAEEVFSDPRR